MASRRLTRLQVTTGATVAPMLATAAGVIRGKSRVRLSCQTTVWPAAMVYEALDANAVYIVRSTGYNQALLRMNGKRVDPAMDGKLVPEFKEWRVDPRFFKEGRPLLTWPITQ